MAAIGALKGPLHGGAPAGVESMLDEIGTEERIKPWIRERLERNERLMGFGHRIYRTEDPRAAALREIAVRLAAGEPWLSLAVRVEEEALRLLEEYKPGRRIRTNVEYYAAALFRAVGLPRELFTPHLHLQPNCRVGGPRHGTGGAQPFDTPRCRLYRAAARLNRADSEPGV